MMRRDIIRNCLAFGATLPLLKPGLTWAAVEQSSPDQWMRHVHPELRPYVAQIQAMVGQVPALMPETLAQARQFMASINKPRATDVPVESRRIGVGPGHPEVMVHIVNAKPGLARPGILYMHGGGFISGTAEGTMRDVQELCRMLDCTAVTVDYRLAPETSYRGSIEDNYAGLKWLHANAAQLGVDPARIAVMGESAGGGHAALLAIAARDRGEVQVAFQCLIYPMLDDRTGSSRIPPPHVGRVIWSAENNRFGWRSFLGVPPGTARVPKSAVPGRTENLAGLPPAFIGVGSIDLFCDEDTEYARRLNYAGVPTELVVVPGAIHGFDIIGVGTRICTQFNDAKIAALRSGLAIAGDGSAGRANA